MAHAADDDASTGRTFASITRRAALVSFGVAGAAFVAFGPRPARENSGGRIVLNYWEKWTGHEGKAMQAVVDRFNASQDRIFVRYMMTSGIDQKATIAIAGGDPPDLVGLNSHNVPSFAETEAIHTLDDLGGISTDRYAAGIRPVMTHPDRQGNMRVWAVPNTGGTVALYYNKALFREVGLNPDFPPQTVAEFDAAAIKLDQIDPDGNIKRVGFMHTEPGWWTFIWGQQFGSNLYDAATNRCTLTEAGNIKAFEWIQSYSRKLGLKPAQSFKSAFATEYSSPRNAFLDGKAAMVVQGPWLANVINTFNPNLDYGVAPLPVDASLLDLAAPIGLVDTDVLLIPRGTKYPNESMEFLKFTQRQDNVEELSLAHFKNTVLATCSPDFQSRHPNKGIATHNLIVSSARSYVAPRTRVWPLLKREVDDVFHRVWNQEGKPADFLASAQQRIQIAMDNARTQARRRGAKV